MNFSTNQNRQFYVASSAEVKTTPKGEEYLVLDGTVRTDLLTNVEYVAKTPAADLAMSKTVATVTLDGEFAVGTPVLLTVEIPNYAGGGDEYSRSTVLSFAVASENALEVDAEGEEAIVKAAVKALTKAFPEYEFAVAVDATEVTITANYKVSNWRLGVSPMRTTTLVVSGKNVTKVETTSGDAIEETASIAVAELEYFCMGERGDQYRMMGYPNIIPSRLSVQNGTYYTLYDFHFSYVGSNEMVQKSEKDITIAVAQTDFDTAAALEGIEDHWTELKENETTE